MKPVIVRDMEPDDAEEAQLVWYASWVDTYVRPDLGVTREWVDERWRPRLTPDGIQTFAEELSTRPAEGQGRYLVAERDRRIVGLAAPFHDPDRGQRVGAIYVAPDQLGTGVGTALMRAVLWVLDPQQPVWLQVAAYNSRAITFYERWGFRRVEGSDQVYRDVIPEFWMRRDPGERAPESLRAP